MTEESSAERNQHLASLRDTELSNAERVLAHRDLPPKGSVKHDAMSNTLPVRPPAFYVCPSYGIILKVTSIIRFVTKLH